jgi:AcrR family transcriptional regulator
MNARLVAPDLPPPSLRELAAAAGVTLPTLAHHFGRREDIIAALLAERGRQGAPYLAEAAMTDLPFGASIEALVALTLGGLTEGGVAALHVLGLREGLRQGRIGPAYVTAILEPTLVAFEARLALHIARGEMIATDPHHAAIALISPLLIAALHQQELGGAQVRCLDLQALARNHTAAFVRAYQANAA